MVKNFAFCSVRSVFAALQYGQYDLLNTAREESILERCVQDKLCVEHTDGVLVDDFLSLSLCGGHAGGAACTREETAYDRNGGRDNKFATCLGEVWELEGL